MKYLFDTDHISLLQRRSGLEYATLVARISPYPPSDLAFSVVSLQEQALGANAYINRATTKAEIIRGYNLLHEIFESFLEATVLPFDMEAATIFEELRQAQVRIGTMDLRIASIALSKGLVLLTRNTSDFSKVPGLVMKDWTL